MNVTSTNRRRPAVLIALVAVLAALTAGFAQPSAHADETNPNHLNVI